MQRKKFTRKSKNISSKDNNKGNNKNKNKQSPRKLLSNKNPKTNNNSTTIEVKKLTPKQDRFVDEYLIDLNATQAAIRAGYSKRTAAVIGCQFLIKFNIQQTIQRRKDELKENTQINQEWVLKRYKMLVDYSVDDFFNNSGELKPLSEIPKDKLYAICGIKTQKTIFTNRDLKRIEETIIREFKLPDKKGVLDSIGKHLGMFEKDNQQKATNMPVQINIMLAD